MRFYWSNTMLRAAFLLAAVATAVALTPAETGEWRADSSAFASFLGISEAALSSPQTHFHTLRATALHKLAQTLADVVPADVLSELAPNLAEFADTEDAVGADGADGTSGSLAAHLKSALSFAEIVGTSSWARAAAATSASASSSAASEYPYFGIIPKLVSQAKAPAQDATPAATWESRCWKTNSVVLDVGTDAYTLKVTDTPPRTTHTRAHTHTRARTPTPRRNARP